MARFPRVDPRVLVLLLAASGAASACSIGTRGGQVATPEPASFEAVLAAPQRVESQAKGSAEFRFNGTAVEYVIRASDITGVTAAHIHQAESRLVIVPFHVDQPTPDSTGVLVRGTFTADDVSVSSPVAFNELINLMRTGGVYLNVHTQAHPGGEIRGAIGLAPTAASGMPEQNSRSRRRIRRPSS